MAITFQLVSVGPHHLTYLATSAGVGDVAGTITPAVMQADVVAGLVKQVVDLADISSQARARRVGLDQGLNVQPGAPPLANVPGHRLRVRITPTTGVKIWDVDADDDGAGNQLEYNVAASALAAAATALIQIEAVGTPEKY